MIITRLRKRSRRSERGEERLRDRHLHIAAILWGGNEAFRSTRWNRDRGRTPGRGLPVACPACTPSPSGRPTLKSACIAFFSAPSESIRAGSARAKCTSDRVQPRSPTRMSRRTPSARARPCRPGEVRPQRLQPRSLLRVRAATWRRAFVPIHFHGPRDRGCLRVARLSLRISPINGVESETRPPAWTGGETPPCAWCR